MSTNFGVPVFLLGAGASVDAGLPMSRDITARVVAELTENSATSRALNLVVAAIIHDDSRRGGRPDELPDVERVVSAIELLATRSTLEVAPFVDWDPSVDSLEQRPRSPANTSSVMREVVRLLAHPPSNARVASVLYDQRLSSALGRFVDDRTMMRRAPVFRQLLDQVVNLLPSLLRVDHGRLGYLLPLVKLANHNTGPLTVATLNYDLALETASLGAGIEVCRGVEGWNETRTVTFDDSPLHLLKLHGSLDWTRVAERDHGARPKLAGTGLYFAKPGQEAPFIVFGQREKLRAEGPFLDLLATFKRSLHDARDLVVVGYAFRDKHINETVANWLVSDAVRRIVIVDPAFAPDTDDDFATELRRWAEKDAGSERVRIQPESASAFFTRIGDRAPGEFVESLFASGK